MKEKDVKKEKENMSSTRTKSPSYQHGLTIEGVSGHRKEECKRTEGGGVSEGRGEG